jgi:uncharacterized protein YcbK (DUF882 family)
MNSAGMEGQTHTGKGMSRRSFIFLGAMASITFLAPFRTAAALSDASSGQRRLSFFNTHTEESLNSTYWIDGKYLSDSLEQMNYILRDHRTGDTRTIDTRLLDFLFALKRKLKSDEPFHIISGYRSPITNQLLRKKNSGVAKKSMHLLGKAVDIRMPDCRLNVLRRSALDLRMGGVGYYPRSDFVHIDIGRIRSWKG